MNPAEFVNDPEGVVVLMLVVLNAPVGGVCLPLSKYAGLDGVAFLSLHVVVVINGPEGAALRCLYLV